MGSFVEECSGLTLTHALYKAALIIAVMRCVVSWALTLRDRWGALFSSSASVETEFPTSSSSVASSKMIRDNLVLTTLGNITERVPDENSSLDTCAVCLNQLKMGEEVREMRNCCHVFHKECIDRWLDHDHITCPLCRAPLLTSSQFHSLTCEVKARAAQPSWAVERLLYLFGDDLLF